jgi:hypothetical protein
MKSGKVIPFPVRRGVDIVKLGGGEDFARALLRELLKALETLDAKRVRVTVRVESLDDEG